MRRRPPLEALLAWLATGPLGHLAAGAADWAALLARVLRARLRGRDRWAP
ncbi:MAG: hypothetical protein M3P39_02865 [Actinomycetota bacterium]|nr:hypothetical protein [Actinomycetota bacterium]